MLVTGLVNIYKTGSEVNLLCKLTSAVASRPYFVYIAHSLLLKREFHKCLYQFFKGGKI